MVRQILVLVRWCGPLALLAAWGCSGQVAPISNQQHLAQFRATLEGLEQLLGQSHSVDDDDASFSEDLVSRLDKLIGIAGELEFATANKSEAAEVAKSISETLNEMYRLAEATPHVEKLRDGVQKVKQQSELLSANL